MTTPDQPSLDYRLSSMDSGSQFIVNIKTAIVTALRNTLDNKDYPDSKIRGIQIHMEYPVKEADYPGIWVEFILTKLTAASIGGQYYLKDDVLTQQWLFEGTIRLTILALSNYERDVYASQLLQMLAFGPMNPISGIFHEYLKSADSKIGIAINSDTLSIGGQQTAFGTPWDDEQIYYQDTYSMQCIGEMDSNFHVTAELLRRIHLTGVLTDDPTGQTKIEEEFGWSDQWS